MIKRRSWNRNELILTFNLYCKLSFGKLHRLNPEIINLSKLINRTSSAVALKLVNFASLDPELKKIGIKGMSNHSKLDEIIYNEFHNDWETLLVESESLLEIFNEQKEEELISIDKLKIGKDRIATVKQRINQGLFRKMILSNYNSTCAICDLNNVKLLVASHIIPWSENKKERLNPHNGLCLCSIHDKSFDVGLISFDKDLRLLVSAELKKNNQKCFHNFFGNYEGQMLNVPKKFYPFSDFLKFHNEKIFLSL